MRKTVVRILTIASLMGFASLAQAGQCGYPFCWGAVAIGPGGVWGFSHSYSSESGAVARVQAECPSCNNVQTFHDSCGAIAQAPDGAWGFGWGDTRDLAEFYAVQKCEEFGNGCAPAVWACSR